MTAQASSASADFPSGDSDAARLIRSRDWGATPLGPVARWSPALRTVIDVMLRSPVAMAVMWGPEGIMLYNDAYAALAGARHPELLGLPLNAGWPEVTELNEHILRVVQDGGSVSYRDQQMHISGGDTPEQMWANFDYSPLLDDMGACFGVLGVVTESTDRIRAERQRAEQFERLRGMLDQAPGFIAMMEGPDHVFVFTNESYMRLTGPPALVGRTAGEAMSQGLLQILDSVYRTGKPFLASDVKLTLPDGCGRAEDHYVDFVYQPIRDAAGEVCGIVAQGHDVTERVLAAEALRRGRQEYRRLNDALIKANDILASVGQRQN